jgi:5-methylcytosine-specific restriction endonuclease McrA
MNKRLQLTGHIVNGIVVMDKIPKPYNGKFSGTYFRCLCHCGNLFNAHGQSLVSGATTSCGCIKGLRKPSSVPPSVPFAGKNTYRPLKYAKTITLSRWTKLVKILGNNMCFRCGSLDDLVSHHIYSWAYKPELLLDIANGICLCTNCHSIYHKTYGSQEKCNPATLYQFATDL